LVRAAESARRPNLLGKSRLTVIYEGHKMLTIEEKENITNGFKTAGERFDKVENEQKDCRNHLDELAKFFRQYGKMVLSGRTETGEKYHHFWQTESMAKEFGELIWQCLGRKAMGEAIGEGGVLVPIEMATWIIQKLGQYGRFRRNVITFPMGSSSILVPKIETDLTIYSPGEGVEIEDSDLSFRQLSLVPRKFACLCAVSNELVEDSIVAVGEIIGASMARSIAKKEDSIGFCGDGTSDYFGMTGIAGMLRAVDPVIANVKGLKVGTGNLWSELTLADFEDVVAILPDDADDNAKWYVNRKFYYSVMHKLAVAAGVANLFEILSPTKQRFFLGYPVEFTSVMPGTEANSQICAILGDLSIAAYIGERRQLTVARSTDVLFKNDQLALRGTERIAINVYGCGDTSESGPIIGLITAAG
jgi:HK97 family phage major capsid protein